MAFAPRAFTDELTLDVALQTAAPTTGQPNSTDASFLVEGSTDQSGAAPGTQNGPYYSWRVPGDLLSLQFAGNANEDFLLLLGPLNANNAVFATTGSLDLGQLGGINSFSDITIALNGVSPVTFLDGLAHLGPGGAQLLVFTLPPSMSGMVFGLQSIITRPGGTALFTAATEVVIL